MSAADVCSHQLRKSSSVCDEQTKVFVFVLEEPETTEEAPILAESSAFQPESGWLMFSGAPADVDLSFLSYGIVSTTSRRFWKNLESFRPDEDEGDDDDDEAKDGDDDDDEKNDGEE